MFIGHFAVGFAAKRWARETPLGLLLLAPLLLDALWPVFCLLGVEQFRIVPAGNPFLNLTFLSYPWSHSLLMAAVWGTLLGLLWRARGGATRTDLLIAGLVVSHWVLDWITHLPDLPLWPGGPALGLGLWNSVPGTIVVESLMLLVGATLYFRATRARDGLGAIGPWIYLALLAGLYGLNILAPAPPLGAERLVAIFALMGMLLVPLAAWFDAHREAR